MANVDWFITSLWLTCLAGQSKYEGKKIHDTVASFFFW